jgi:diguanylate cyclase (GGDEF)-like protein
LKAGEPAIPIFERIRATVAETGIATRAGQVTVTLSIGVATAAETAKATDTPEYLLSLADAAMYRAKKSGRNRVLLADERD